MTARYNKVTLSLWRGYCVIPVQQNGPAVMGVQGYYPFGAVFVAIRDSAQGRAAADGSIQADLNFGDNQSYICQNLFHPHERPSGYAPQRGKIKSMRRGRGGQRPLDSVPFDSELDMPADCGRPHRAFLHVTPPRMIISIRSP